MSLLVIAVVVDEPHGKLIVKTLQKRSRCLSIMKSDRITNQRRTYVNHVCITQGKGP